MTIYFKHFTVSLSRPSYDNLATAYMSLHDFVDQEVRIGNLSKAQAFRRMQIKTSIIIQESFVAVGTLLCAISSSPSLVSDMLTFLQLNPLFPGKPRVKVLNGSEEFRKYSSCKLRWQLSYCIL